MVFVIVAATTIPSDEYKRKMGMDMSTTMKGITWVESLMKKYIRI